MMDIRSNEEDIPMPISSSFTAINEPSRMLSTGGIPTEEKMPKKNVKYRECLKNHAANLGGHVTDGCGEFMPSGEDGTLDSLKCAACDCHRNFHRREIEGEERQLQQSCSHDCFHDRNVLKRPGSSLVPLAFPQSGHGVLPRPPPQMIMAFNSNAAESEEHEGAFMSGPSGHAKKRFRTKFSQEQKDKMLGFADKLGWKIQKHDEAAVQNFCHEVGVKRHVLKVWMHNNKHTLGKSSPDSNNNNNNNSNNNSSSV